MKTEEVFHFTHYVFRSNVESFDILNDTFDKSFIKKAGKRQRESEREREKKTIKKNKRSDDLSRSKRLRQFKISPSY